MSICQSDFFCVSMGTYFLILNGILEFFIPQNTNIFNSDFFYLNYDNFNTTLFGSTGMLL